MINLIVHRHYQTMDWDHETFEDAAADAIGQLDCDESYPVKILDGDKVLWEHDNLIGDALDVLREVAIKGGYKE
ncbi:hypothetical protein LCGC14_2021470 [marine sediment metagenome]|uniref:Uncharacterized protein n=1 Tax=marine sediment metagenome TaxID=412755 RepID=A0A0F9EXM7_9ZZZZ